MRKDDRNSQGNEIRTLRQGQLPCLNNQKSHNRFEVYNIECQPKQVVKIFHKDYKKKSADTHGVRSAGGNKFNYDYIFDVLKKTVNRKYLDLPKKKD